MSFEALYQAETLQAQREAERRRAAHVAEQRSARVPAPGRSGGRGWPALRLPALHLPHRHPLPAPGRVRVVG